MKAQTLETLPRELKSVLLRLQFGPNKTQWSECKWKSEDLEYDYEGHVVGTLEGYYDIGMDERVTDGDGNALEEYSPTHWARVPELP